MVHAPVDAREPASGGIASATAQIEAATRPFANLEVTSSASPQYSAIDAAVWPDG